MTNLFAFQMSPFFEAWIFVYLNLYKKSKKCIKNNLTPRLACALQIEPDVEGRKR